MDLSQLRGIFPPLLTPLAADGEVDLASLQRLVDHVLAGGVHGVWAMGTTGEFACLTEQARARGIETVVERVGGRVPVVANIGDGSTSLALRHAAHAVAAGVDALAATPPHYFPHSPDEVRSYFKTIKAAYPEVPLLAYNIPQTVKVKMTLVGTLELARDGTLAGIKDSQNDLQWFRALTATVRAEGLGAHFRVFLGTRTLIDVGVAAGADGAIPANSNVVPSVCVEAYTTAAEGQLRQAESAQDLATAYEQLSSVARGGSANAATISTFKNILHLWGIIDDPAVASPLRPLAPEEIAELTARLQSLPRPGVTEPPALTA